MKLGDFSVEARHGTSGAISKNVSFGNMQNFNADTVGLFLPDVNNGAVISYNRVNALDRSSDNWRGHVNLFVNAEESDEYTLNILSSTGQSGRKFEVTVNGILQTVTDAVSNDTTRNDVYSTLASQAVNVSKLRVPLSAGLNVIRLQSPIEVAAPNFMAATVTPLSESLIILAKENDIVTGKYIVVNKSDVPISYRGALAIYDAGGTLADLKEVSGTLAAGGRENKTLYLQAGYLAKGFLWDDSNQPLAPFAVIE
jgi:hypothetical protein